MLLLYAIIMLLYAIIMQTHIDVYLSLYMPLSRIRLEAVVGNDHAILLYILNA